MSDDSLKWKSIELVNIRQDLKEEYIKFLYNCHKDYQTRKLFTNDMNIKNSTDFVKDFRKKSMYKYHEFMIIKNIKSNQLIGFIYSYRYNPNDGTLYTTIYMDLDNRNTVYSVEAGLVFYDYLFNKYSIRKIYCTVYSYNDMSIKFLKSAGFKLEGNLKKSKYFDGNYYDTYIFALYKNDFLEMKNKLKK